MKPEAITFAPEAILYADIYTPFTGFGSGQFQFLLDVEHLNLPPELDNYVTHRSRGPQKVLRIRSRRRPPVHTPQSYDLLARALAILEAQNKPRDAIFKWCRLITVFTEEWRTVASWGVMQGHEICGLSPASVSIVLDEDRIPS